MNYNLIISSFCDMHQLNRTELLKHGNDKRVETGLQCLLKILIRDLQLDQAISCQLIGINNSSFIDLILKTDYSLNTYYAEFNNKKTRLQHRKLIVTEQLNSMTPLEEIEPLSEKWDKQRRDINNAKGRLETIKYQLNNIRRGKPVLGEKDALESAVKLPPYMNF